MRVLVTAGSGYVGSHTVRGLSGAGYDISVYDDLSTGHRKLSDGFKLIEGDISDWEKLIHVLKRVNAVMHFAASAYVGESVLNPRKYFHNNVESALQLVDAVLESGVRLFVFSSSCAVYGIPQKLPIVESSPKEPLNPLQCDQAVPIARTRGLRRLSRTAIRRLALLQCGWGSHQRDDRGVPQSPNPPYVARAQGSAGDRTAAYHLRTEPGHTGWNLHPRLRSCAGPGVCSSPGPELSR
jgi:NAD dependent epimerase/dehydratase family